MPFTKPEDRITALTEKLEYESDPRLVAHYKMLIETYQFVGKMGSKLVVLNPQ